MIVPNSLDAGRIDLGENSGFGDVVRRGVVDTANEFWRFYFQIVFGEGIGSYRGLPDAAPETPASDQLLGLTGWMVGFRQDWTDRLNSNFTYAENALGNTQLQQPDYVYRTTYLAANVIWEPVDRVNVGIEYLHGLRENVDRNVSGAHRLQVAFIFRLP